MRLLILSALLGLAGCKSAPTCSLDPSKLVSWNNWAALQQPGEETYTSVYADCGKQVTFVAAAHSNEAGSDTYLKVRAAFDAASPEFVIAEGFPTDMGRSPDAMIGYAAEMEGTPGDFEPLLTIRLAAEAGIPFVGGEPVDKSVLEDVTASGVTAEDLFGYYIVRQIDQWVQSGEASSYSDPAIDALIADYAASFTGDTGLSAGDLANVSTFDAFRIWYEKTNGLPYATGFRPEDAWPTSPETDRQTNRLSNRVADVRDRHLQGVLSDALSEFDRVLIVYGASHHLVHAQALESAFGKPVP